MTSGEPANATQSRPGARAWRDRVTLRPGMNRALWVLQFLLAAFFAIASAAPKLFGESTAVEIFDDIGIGQWFRYVVGALALAGAIGLLIPRLAALAALGLAALMVAATFTNIAIIDGGVAIITTSILFVLCAFIAWMRRGELRPLLDSGRHS